MSVALNVGKQIQEQTQIIATAIGKPAAKAPTIIKVNAESRFASGRSLSTDMSLAPPRGQNKKSHRDECGDGSRPRRVSSKVSSNAARIWLTKR
jgi:hypothetical protein